MQSTCTVVDLLQSTCTIVYLFPRSCLGDQPAPPEAGVLVGAVATVRAPYNTASGRDCVKSLRLCLHTWHTVRAPYDTTSGRYCVKSLRLCLHGMFPRTRPSPPVRFSAPQPCPRLSAHTQTISAIQRPATALLPSAKGTIYKVSSFFS